MKAIIFLLLCGLSCAFGRFNCNSDHPKMEECMDQSELDLGKDFDESTPYPETEAKLKVFCKFFIKAMQCQIDFATECPRTLTGALRESNEDLLKAFQRICNDKDHLHQKYLENISCFNKEKESTEKECEERAKGKEYCKGNSEKLRCTEDKIINTCGADSNELVTELYKHEYSFLRVFCG